MYEAALVGERHVGSDEGVICYGLAEDFDAKHICDDFFCFPLQIWVDECDMVVGYDDVTEC